MAVTQETSRTRNGYKTVFFYYNSKKIFTSYKCNIHKDTFILIIFIQIRVITEFVDLGF